LHDEDRRQRPSRVLAGRRCGRCPGRGDRDRDGNPTEAQEGEEIVMATNPVSEFLRTHLAELQDSWVRTVTERLPALHVLEHAALIDHLPEFLIGLASWIEGDETAGGRGFGALVQGHALQRLGHGIPLEVLTHEYHLLRMTILRA